MFLPGIPHNFNFIAKKLTLSLKKRIFENLLIVIKPIADLVV